MIPPNQDLMYLRSRLYSIVRLMWYYLPSFWGVSQRSPHNFPVTAPIHIKLVAFERFLTGLQLHIYSIYIGLESSKLFLCFQEGAKRSSSLYSSRTSDFLCSSLSCSACL